MTPLERTLARIANPKANNRPPLHVLDVDLERTPVKHSVNDFNRALSNVDVTVVEQNRAVEQMNYDVVDIINQIVSATGPSPVTVTPLKTPQDVAFLMAQCAARLRILLNDRSK